MSSQSRIELQGISVEYSLLTVAEQNLKRKVMTGLGRRRKGEVETLAALDQVSLLLRPGTRLGVIGPNGAGKSTLLRVLAGALPPTRGRVHIDGKVFSLLGGAGAGLDYGLSGYENLIMSGLLLGESASAMKDRAAEIAEFSGLGDRLSNPISTYSSGMLARLRFSILTSLRPQILIMDEGVATADKAFTEKATARLREFRDSAEILVMSAHGSTVQDWADTAMWLDHGRIVAIGEAEMVTSRYLEWASEHGASVDGPRPEPFAAPSIGTAVQPARPLFLLGSPRTGSTLLSTVLLQHPDVHMHGEVFHPEASERQATHALRNRAKSWFDPESDDALEFLDTWVFGMPQNNIGKPVSVVGVKVFGDHVGGTGTEKLFARLRAHYPHGAFIHVRRRNYLDVLISREIARRSRVWVDWSHEEPTSVSVDSFSIPPEEAREFFSEMKRTDDFFASHFAGPGYLAVDYEDMAADLEGVAASVFDFLGLGACSVQEVTRKQVGDQQRSKISNLAALEDEYVRFCRRAGLPWQDKTRTNPPSVNA